MIATVFHELYLVIIVYKDDNLFSRRALCSHIDFWFGLVFTIDDFLNVFNFFCLEIQKGLFNLKNFSNINGSLRCLSIQFSHSCCLEPVCLFWRIWGFLLPPWVIWLELVEIISQYSLVYPYSSLLFFLIMMELVLGVNLCDTFCLKEFLFLLAKSKSWPKL